MADQVFNSNLSVEVAEINEVHPINVSSLSAEVLQFITLNQVRFSNLSVEVLFIKSGRQFGPAFISVN
jgi:hypothetical protein